MIDELSVPGGTFSYIDFVGGYFADNIQADPGSRFELDEILISDEHIGPPEGFLR
jgi:hypothetical protein